MMIELSDLRRGNWGLVCIIWGRVYPRFNLRSKNKEKGKEGEGREKGEVEKRQRPMETANPGGNPNPRGKHSILNCKHSRRPSHPGGQRIYRQGKEGENKENSDI